MLEASTGSPLRLRLPAIAKSRGGAANRSGRRAKSSATAPASQSAVFSGAFVQLRPASGRLPPVGRRCPGGQATTASGESGGLGVWQQQQQHSRYLASEESCTISHLLLNFKLLPSPKFLVCLLSIYLYVCNLRMIYTRK